MADKGAEEGEEEEGGPWGEKEVRVREREREVKSRGKVAQ